MDWMRANWLKLNPGKAENLSVGSHPGLGSELMPTLGTVALTESELSWSV